MKKYFLALIVLLSATSIYAQEGGMGLKHYHTVNSGMYTLLGWSVLNIAGSGYLSLNQSGTSKYFHQMNAGWNIVNLGLAVGGLYGLDRAEIAGMDAISLLEETSRMEKLFLFNAGLDVGYMAFGLYMNERGLRMSSDRLKGFGRSLILQGGFLFAFDLIMFGLTNHNTLGIRQDMVFLSPASQGVGFALHF